MYKHTSSYVPRYEWYQTETHVVVTVLLKKVQKDDLKIDIQDRNVSSFTL